MKKWQLVGTTVLGASVLLGACGGNDGGSGDGKDLKGSAKGEGRPIVEKLNENGLKIIKTLKFLQVKPVQVLVSKNSLLAKLISQTLQDLLKTKKRKIRR